MRVTLYHTLQLTCCCMQLVASSWNFLALCLHVCYIRKECIFHTCFNMCTVCGVCTGSYGDSVELIWQLGPHHSNFYRAADSYRDLSLHGLCPEACPTKGVWPTQILLRVIKENQGWQTDKNDMTNKMLGSYFGVNLIWSFCMCTEKVFHNGSCSFFFLSRRMHVDNVRIRGA